MTNKKIVMDALEAYQNKSKDLPDFFSVDVVWNVQGDTKKIPIAGTFKGMRGIQKKIEQQAELIEVQPPFTVKGIMGGEMDDQFSVLIHERVLVKSTCKEYEMDFAMIITVKDKKINRIESIMDTLAVAQAFED